MWLLFFVLFGLVIYVLYTLTTKRVLLRSEEEPLSILKRRLALGEISEEQYERLKNTITGNK